MRAGELLSIDRWRIHPPRWLRRAVGPRRLQHLIDQLQPPETGALITTSVLVGLGAGASAVIFRYLIELFQDLFFGQGASWLGFMGSAYVIVVPAVGGLLVGPIVYFLAREAKGHGVPEVMEAVALRGGRIRPVVVVVKSVASSICIGSGGSVGREGPIVQVGSAIGSSIGQALHLSEARIRNLVACGAAGGIAATFNAPIAGVLFALEVILGEFSVGYFSTVVIAAVTASVVGHFAFGDVPAFVIPKYTLASEWELLLYVALGVLAGIAAALYVGLLYRLEDLFDDWRFPEYLKPALGGLLVGFIGFRFPEVFGVGYEGIERVLTHGHEMAVAGLLLLAVAKILATSLTIGSGGSGGVFAPSLFIGAMLGGAFGAGAHSAFPQLTAGPGAYALVGMSALFAGAAHAPITSVIILFEMTNDYRIILPLMLATVVSTLVSQRIARESIYTRKLIRRGVRLEQGRDIDVMQSVLVHEAMSTSFETVSADLPLPDLEEFFNISHHHGFPVLDADGRLFGIVTLGDLEQAVEAGPVEGRHVRDIATRDLLVAHPDEPVQEALRRLGARDVGRLPVVDRDDATRLLGVIRRHDIVRAYRLALGRKVEMQARAERLRLGKLTGTEFVELVVGPSSPAARVPIQELDLPEDCVLVSIRRADRTVIPHGDTQLAPGDRVTALVGQNAADCLRATFC